MFCFHRHLPRFSCSPSNFPGIAWIFMKLTVDDIYPDSSFEFNSYQILWIWTPSGKLHCLLVTPTLWPISITSICYYVQSEIHLLPISGSKWISGSIQMWVRNRTDNKRLNQLRTFITKFQWSHRLFVNSCGLSILQWLSVRVSPW